MFLWRKTKNANLQFLAETGHHLWCMLVVLVVRGFGGWVDDICLDLIHDRLLKSTRVLGVCPCSFA